MTIQSERLIETHFVDENDKPGYILTILPIWWCETVIAREIKKL